jgi:hypothetical protein
MSPKALILSSLLLALGFAESAHAFCVEKYEFVSHYDEQIAKQYETVVEKQDRYRYYHQFNEKLEKDPINPFRIVYDVLSQPADNYKSSEAWKDEVPDDKKREIATRLWLDQQLVRDLLVDSFHGDLGNAAFARLWNDIHDDVPGFVGSASDVMNAINQANWRGSFCREEAKTVFVQNRFGKLYSTPILSLETYTDIKQAIESGAWAAEPLPEPVVPSLSYPQNPWNDQP